MPPANKIPRRAVRGKKGGLATMPSMPWDVCLEVFSHLEPRDLLNLSRTDKALRNCLMSRNVAFLWRIARRQVEGLPDCPSHLSEPAYANLAFSPHCHNCLKVNVQTVLWHFSVRYCDPCKKLRTTVRVQEPRLLNLKPPLSICSLLCNMEVGRRGTKLYHVLEMHDLEASVNQFVKSCVDLEKFAEDRQSYVKAIAAHANLCIAWEHKRNEVRSEELSNIKVARVEAIMGKLRELGWGEELDALQWGPRHAFRKLRQVSQPKPLTDRSWQAIRGEVVAFMEATKAERLTSQLPSRLRSFLQVLTGCYSAPPGPETDQMPSFTDLANMTCFRQRLEASNITADDLRRMLPDAMVDWQNVIRTELIALMSQKMSFADGVDPLNLAVAVFDCTQCQRVLRYPALLAHDCLRHKGPLLKPIDAKSTCYEDVVSNISHERKWDISRADFASTFERTDALMQACGLFSNSTDTETMAQLGVRVIASPIDKANDIRKIMTWRTAFENRWPGMNWAPLNILDYPQMAELDASAYGRMVDWYAQLQHWCCKLCRNPDGRKQGIYKVCDHLKMYHNIVGWDACSSYIYQSADGWSVPGPVWSVKSEPGTASLS